MDWDCAFWQAFPGHYKGHPAIWAWDLRNELLYWEQEHMTVGGDTDAQRVGNRIRDAWPKWLETRYGTVEAMDRVYGANHASFAAVPGAVKFVEKPYDLCAYDFRNYLNDRGYDWCKRQCDVIRAVAPGHMIVSGNNAWVSPDQDLFLANGFHNRALHDLFDFVTFHPYPAWECVPGGRGDPLDGGDFELWHRFDRTYNHAQFSPTDPDEALFAEEFHADPITGLTFPITNRMWVIRRGQKPRPILREPKWVTHEWWDADGKHVWCVWGNDTWRVRVADGEVEQIPFPRHCWHSHSSRDGRLIVGDSNNGFYRGCASTVHFMNRDTGKVIVLAEHAERTDYAGRNYHIDPHPRFCYNDQYVVFTTTVRGEIDVAIVPTAELVQATT